MYYMNLYDVYIYIYLYIFSCMNMFHPGRMPWILTSEQIYFQNLRQEQHMQLQQCPTQFYFRSSPSKTEPRTVIMMGTL